MQFTHSPEIDAARCDGCGACLPVCPSGALTLDGRKVVLWRPDLCRWDSACEFACPQGAIRVPYVIVFAEDAGHAAGRNPASLPSTP